MRRHLALLLLAMLLVLALAWPLPAHITDRALLDPLDADLQCGLWWPDAFLRSVAAFENPFFRKDLVWPDGQDLRLLIWNVGVQLVFFPVYALLDPLPSLNVVALLGAIFNGLACGQAAWMLTGRRSSAVTALAIGACAPYGLWESGVGRPEQGLWAPIPLTLAALFKLEDEPGQRRWIALGAISLAITGAIYWFYAYFLVLVIVGHAAYRLATRRLDRQGLWDLTQVGLGSLVLVLPLLLPIVAGMAEGGNDYDKMKDARDFIEQQRRTSVPFPDAWMGHWSKGHTTPSMKIPALALPIGLLGLIFGKSRGRALAVVGVVALVMAAGPQAGAGSESPLPLRALDLLPGFDRFWWPYRFSGLAIPALAITAALLVDRVGRAWIPAVILTVLSLVDGHLSLGQDGHVLLYPVVPSPGLAALAAEGAGKYPVVIFPLGGESNGQIGLQALHLQPMDTGLAWSEAVRTEAWTRRQEEVPLFKALKVIEEGGTPEKLPPDGGGGFKFVLAMKIPTKNYEVALGDLLGAPIWEEQRLILFAVPGTLDQGTLQRLQGARGGAPTHLAPPDGAIGPPDGALGPPDGAQGPPLPEGGTPAPPFPGAGPDKPPDQLTDRPAPRRKGGGKRGKRPPPP